MLEDPMNAFVELDVDGKIDVVLEKYDPIPEVLATLPANLLLANGLFLEDDMETYEQDSELCAELLFQLLKHAGWFFDHQKLERIVKRVCLPGAPYDRGEVQFAVWKEEA